MDHKKLFIIIVVVIVIFIAIQWIFIPKNELPKLFSMSGSSENEAKTLYEPDYQLSPIQKYASQYVGDMNNTTQLFYHLPLNHLKMKFELETQTTILTVRYFATIDSMDPKYLSQNLLYNATASFLLIENVGKIVFEFEDGSYEVTREYIENLYSDFSEMTQPEVFEENTRQLLEQNSNLEKFEQECLKRSI